MRREDNVQKLSNEGDVQKGLCRSGNLNVQQLKHIFPISFSWILCSWAPLFISWGSRSLFSPIWWDNLFAFQTVLFTFISPSSFDSSAKQLLWKEDQRIILRWLPIYCLCWPEGKVHFFLPPVLFRIGFEAFKYIFHIPLSFFFFFALVRLVDNLPKATNKDEFQNKKSLQN